jgi:hypothetical protein
MTLGELLNALRETGAALDENVRASIDPRRGRYCRY